MQSHLPSRFNNCGMKTRIGTEKRIQGIFDDQAVQVIMKIQVNNDQVADRLCWKHTSSGDCSSKSVYKHLMAASHMTHTAIPSLTLNLLRKSWAEKFIPPKVKTFMWRLLQNALPTANNLHARISEIQNSCARCNMTETSVHLFFHCAFARLSWHISDFNLNIQIIDNMNSVPDILAIILATCPFPSALQKLSILLWFIWIARSDFYFKKKIWEPVQVCIAANVMAANFSQILDLTAEDCLHDNNHTMDYGFNIPQGIRCFVDASWKDDKLGFGIFVHDPQSHRALFIQASSAIHTNATQAELAVILLALRVCNLLNFSGVVILSDNLTLVKLLRHRNFVS